MDEGDDLPETTAINELLAIAQVTVVAIAHDGTDWLSRLDVTDSHPFDQCHVELGRYGVAERADILKRRARQGLHGQDDIAVDIVLRSYLERIADTVAVVARDGIQTLRAAAERAQVQGFHRVDEADIGVAQKRAKHSFRQLNLESLPFHHQVLYAIVHDAGEIATTDLHERYDAIADDIYSGVAAHLIGEWARRGKFPKLKEYDLVEYDEATTKDRVYEMVDTNVEPMTDFLSRVTRR